MTIDSKLLHDRAREAGSELRRMLMGLSSGSIGVLFLATTSEISPPLSKPEILFAVSTILAHSVSLVFALAAWRYDAKRNYFWALSLDDERSEGKKDIFTGLRYKFQKYMITTDLLAGVCFGVGVVTAVAYLLLRTIS